MQKELIIRKLKEQGCRITKQRRILIDIILEEECSCCKEIYYKASALDGKIGVATVYRMINKLEEIGAISRKNMYRVSDDAGEAASGCSYTVELEDGTRLVLSSKKWKQIIKSGLQACGYAGEQAVCSVKENSGI